MQIHPVTPRPVTSAAANTTGLDNCPLLARPDLSDVPVFSPLFLFSFYQLHLQVGPECGLSCSRAMCVYLPSQVSLKIPHHIFLSLPAGKEIDQ